MVSVAGGCMAMRSLSGGSAERLGLHVERPRQPLKNHRRRSALDLPVLEDADEALRDLGPLCQLVLTQSFRFPQLLDDLPDLPRHQGSTPIGQNDVSRQTHLVGWSAYATRSSPRAAGRGRSQRKELRGRRGGSRLSGSDRERGDGAGGLAWAIGVRMPTIPASSRARNAEPRRLERMAQIPTPARASSQFCRRAYMRPSPYPLPR